MSGNTRTEDITRELRDEVLRGQYRPGERLPSERDLAARFGTTRDVARIALKKLEQLGVAAVEPGGARVQPRDGWRGHFGNRTRQRRRALQDCHAILVTKPPATEIRKNTLLRSFRRVFSFEPFCLS